VEPKIISTCAILWILLACSSACTINIHYPAAGIPPAPGYSQTAPPQHTEKSSAKVADLLDMWISVDGVEKPVLNAGESFELNVRIAVNAYVHCFYQQSNREIFRIYPNSKADSGAVEKTQLVRIPDGQQFSLISGDGEEESLLCLAANENVSEKLPIKFRQPGFAPLPLNDFDALYALYRKTTNRSVMGRVLTVPVR